MAALLHRLPPVKSTTTTYYDHSNDQWFKDRFSSNTTMTSSVLPSKVLDFGDGGAFPEIHKPQYPLGMGKEDTKSSKPQSKTLPHKDLVPRILRDNEEEEEEENKYSEEEIEKTTAETKAALEKIVNDDGEDKRVPKASGEPPVPVLHSPPRPVSFADKKEWSIPPCISQFKNPKGYTIPLDKREGVDGRRLQDVQVSENFAHLPDALHAALLKCKEELDLRTKVQMERKEEQETREQELRNIARRARAEGTAFATAVSETNGEKTATDIDETREERLKRDEIRRERERERRLTKNKRSRVTRDGNRDISEKIALGMACTGVGAGSGEEVMPKKDVDADTYGGADEQLDKIMKTDRFKPHKGFGGTTERAGPRDRPVEFDQDVTEADPFGLDEIMAKMKKAR
ncbi:hypothetical protein ACLB2K_036184 [Fragaria x ananassa]